ncbi:MAG: Protein translocase subunit SecD [Patescibacteria group bacterium]|nr:Protein translocase subunit SecD [Patescibacteria group bacterium]
MSKETPTGLGTRLAVVGVLAISCLAYAFPWKSYGIPMPFENGEYKLGLDLHGGVELDYKIDLEEAKKKGGDYNEKNVVEGLKSIVEKRVNSLGTAEPTIQTASYGGESHIVVQIPTQNFAGEDLTEEQKQAKNSEYIAKAKETIGKVVRLEFKEKKASITDADRAERKAIAEAAAKEAASAKDFAVIGKKYRDGYENVEYAAGSGTVGELPLQFAFTGVENVAETQVTDAFASQKSGSLTLGEDGKVAPVAGAAGFSVVRVSKVSGTGTGTVFEYEGIFVDERPSEWTLAKTVDGKALDERYLMNASVSFNQGFQPQIELLFNNDGAKIFGELTKRMVGQQLAIFVGGQMLTDPVVQTTISDGKAVITGNYTPESAKQLANDINTGIVPAPIYLTSERAIDAKIGGDSLNVIVNAGLIGLLAIVVFLVAIYRVSGLLAGLALVIYGIILLALVKAFGIVMTLASIAGIILSIGLAIDANVLIFERTKEALREGADLGRAIVSGFEKSWTAIWDSHVTSLTSAIILWIFGISLIKGFGLMLGLGIVLSLFTAMWVSRILILFFGQSYEGRADKFIGLKK